MNAPSIHIHEDDWGMRALHPVSALAEIAADVAEAQAAGERNREPDGFGWTSVHLIKSPSIDFTATGLTFAAADAALAPVLPRVAKFTATAMAGFTSDKRDPYGSYEDDAHCYGRDAGCFIKLDGKDATVSAIWFEANTDADGLAAIRTGIEAIDQLTPCAIADYWLDCSGAVSDKRFMDSYFRALAGVE